MNINSFFDATVDRPALSTVKVGDSVWVGQADSYGCFTTHHTTKISYIDDKGRLYVCTEKVYATRSGWRYGFDTTTGQCKHNYSKQRLLAIAPRERAAIDKAKADEATAEAAKEEFRQTQVYKDATALRCLGMDHSAEELIVEYGAARLHACVDILTSDRNVLDILRIIVANAVVISDPRMQGATNCYSIPLDDIEAAQALLERLK
jgi:hypothetical protein